MALTAVLLIAAASVSLVPSGQEPPPATFLRQLIETSEGEEENLPRREASEVLDELEKVLNRVASAFERGDVDLLERHLVSSRIYISLKSRGEEAGYKGKPQIKFMLARLFGERQTKSFLYEASDRELMRGGKRAVAHADWTYVVLNEDEIVTEHLRFELERTEQGWRVFEIVGGSR